MSLWVFSASYVVTLELYIVAETFSKFVTQQFALTCKMILQRSEGEAGGVGIAGCCQGYHCSWTSLHL